MAKTAGPVAGRAGTHADVHVAAVAGQAGRVPGTGSFPARAPGYAGMPAWTGGHGGLARTGAVKARTQAASQPRGLITTAPGLPRARLQGLGTPRRVRAAFTCGGAAGPAEGTKAAMAGTARRWQDPGTGITRPEAALDHLAARAAAPGYPALTGAGPRSTAALTAAAGGSPGRIRTGAASAALCGASTADCSSGRHGRHRLNGKGPAGQLRAAADRRYPPALRSSHPGLSRSPGSRGQDPQGNHPLSQALRRPPGLPQAHQARLPPGRRHTVREGRLTIRGIRHALTRWCLPAAGTMVR